MDACLPARRQSPASEVVGWTREPVEKSALWFVTFAAEASRVEQLGCVSYLDCMDATVQDDGKIAIPKVLRDALGLNPGTVVDLQQQAGALVARKKTDSDAFEKWRGRGQIT